MNQTLLISPSMILFGEIAGRAKVHPASCSCGFTGEENRGTKVPSQASESPLDDGFGHRTALKSNFNHIHGILPKRVGKDLFFLYFYNL